MTEAARVAGPADVDLLASLAADAVDEQREARGGELLVRRDSRPRPADDWLRASIASPDELVLVGTWDDVGVGYAVGHTEVLADGGRLAVLDELYVQPEARAVAVGEALMDAVLDWAVAQGCFGIDSTVLPGNRESKNFFERYGLTARAIRVHRRLEPR